MIYFFLQLLLSFLLILVDFALCHFVNKRVAGLEKLEHKAVDWKESIARSSLISLNAHMSCLLFLIFALHKYIYRWDFKLETFFVYCLGFVIFTVCFYLLCTIFKTYYIKERAEKWHLYSNFLFFLLGASLLGLAGFMFFASQWMSVFFGKIAPDQLIFTIVGGGGGDATADTNAQVANFVVTPVVISIILGSEISFFHMAHRSKKSRQRLITLATKRGLVSLLMFVLFIASAIYMCKMMPIIDVIKSQFSSSKFIENEYVNPFEVVRFPAKSRNFIHILMESVENSYYSKDLGGYDERNLMPELAKLNEEALHFSHTTKSFGGPHQTYGASHSIAGMINMNAGIPMKTDILGNQGVSLLYPDFVTLGDLFASQGYNNYFMLGADATWSDLGKWYKNHGNFEVFDYTYAKENSYIPEDYKVWWGYEDDKLYEFAKEKLTRLAEEDKPFYFVLENADTHFPDGYASELMKDRPYKEQYANVIHYSQAEVVKFVDWIKEQDFYENTTILITGDHKSMDKNFFKDWDQTYERTIVNMYINPLVELDNKERMYERDFAPFDFFATTLATLGVKIEGDRVGLGTNLLSQKKTLLEEYGSAYVNEQLIYPSTFYSTHRRSDEEKEKIKNNLANKRIDQK